jgi:hypothetical protein
MRAKNSFVVFLNLLFTIFFVNLFIFMTCIKISYESTDFRSPSIISSLKLNGDPFHKTTEALEGGTS